MARLRLASTLFAIAAIAGVSPALAQQDSCRGRNLLTELTKSDAEAAKAIRADFDASGAGKAVLWRVVNEDTPNHAPSYLFATLPSSDTRLLVLPQGVKQALSASRRVALATEDSSAGRLFEALTTLGEHTALPEGDRLDKLVPGSNSPMIQRNLKRVGFDTSFSARIRPWVASLMLSTSECEYQRAMAGKATLDREIARIGEDHGIGAIGLETTEQQLQLLAALPDAQQLSMLKATMKLSAQQNDLGETLVQLYLSRDLGAITPLRVALLRKSGADDEAIQAFLNAQIHVRTRRMRDRVVGHLHQGGVFVAIGAEHIPGEAGMVALLTEAGFKVTPLE